MEDEIRWKVTIGPGECWGVMIYINDEKVGHDMSTYMTETVVKFLRNAGQDIVDVVSRELGA